jgi:hypothetical protein
MIGRVAAAVAVAAALVGCSETAGAVAPDAARPAAGPTQQAVIYLMGGQKIAPVARRVRRTPGVAAAAMRALLRGPTAQERHAGYKSFIPSGTRLLGVDVAGGVATVDLTGRFESGGGSHSMTARVAQVVHTLTRFPSVERVAFRLDGRPAEAIGGEGVVVDPPVDRADFEALTPAILIESPLPGNSARSPLRVSGTANVFEATFLIDLLDKDGGRLKRAVVTATSGTGTRGSFAVTLRFRGRARVLLAYAESPRDGRPIHRVRIPLR